VNVDGVGLLVAGVRFVEYPSMELPTPTMRQAGYTRVSQFIPWIKVLLLSLTQNTPICLRLQWRRLFVDANELRRLATIFGQMGVGLSAERRFTTTRSAKETTTCGFSTTVPHLETQYTLLE